MALRRSVDRCADAETRFNCNCRICRARHRSFRSSDKPTVSMSGSATLSTGGRPAAQRVAFALSEIMVGRLSALNDMPYAMADYYDTLAEHAFGNYRELLEAITLHPVMGNSLSMLGNEKPDPVPNIRPDENYAREAVLFSIGLGERKIHGSEKRDAIGQAIRPIADKLSRALRMSTPDGPLRGRRGFQGGATDAFNQVIPMQLYPEFLVKMLLNGETLRGAGPRRRARQYLQPRQRRTASSQPDAAPRRQQSLTACGVWPKCSMTTAPAYAATCAAPLKAILLDDDIPAVVSKIDGKLSSRCCVSRGGRTTQALAAGVDGCRCHIIFLGEGDPCSPVRVQFFSPTSRRLVRFATMACGNQLRY